jgi:hypothetical protein
MTHVSSAFIHSVDSEDSDAGVDDHVDAGVDAEPDRPRPLSRVQAGLALVVFTVVAIARGVDNTWDLQHYHLAVGWSAARGELVNPDWVVAGSMSFFNPTIDAIHVVLMEQSPWLAHVVMAAPAFVTVIVLVYFIRDIVRCDTPVWSWIRLTLAMLAVLGTDAIGQIGGTMADLTLTLPIVSGTYLIYRSLSRPHVVGRWSVLGGSALLGAAMGLKITLIPVSVGLAFGAFLGVARLNGQQRTDRRVVHVVAGLVGGWALSGGLWAAYLWRTFGNPVFPFLNNLFGSKWATDESWSTPYHLSPVDLVAFPVRVTFVQARHNVSPYEFIEPRFALGLIGVGLLAATIVRQRRRDGSWVNGAMSAPNVLLGAGWLTAYVLWAVLLANARYAVPLLALSVPVALVGLVEFFGETSAPRQIVRAVGAGLAAALILSTSIVLVTGAPEWGPRTTDPRPSWTFPDGPRSDGRTPPIDQWQWQDVVTVSARWPLGFMVAELKPRRIWNLREPQTVGRRYAESTDFGSYAADTLDRSGSLVVYDPRLDDVDSITRRLGRWLGEPVSVSACGIFDNGWTPAAVCRFQVDE